jgi:hypothetical protein
MESIPAISPAAHGWRSNRLTAADADAATVALLRERFRGALRDRRGAAATSNPVRMLEKTPKNALRVPLLAAAFPEARFVYLYRDPRPTLSSMIEGWLSGGFRTYPNLPGWRGPDWSFVLTPGWRDLIGQPLPTIVAAQWAATTRILLDDLAALPRDRWLCLTYEDFLADPQAQALRLARELDFAWDRQLSRDLPLSRHTASKPDPDKWRLRAGEIEAVWSILAAEDGRARGLIKSRERRASSEGPVPARP